MNFFDFLAWPLAIITTPIFLVAILMLAIILSWLWLRPWISEAIDPGWYGYRRRFHRFRERVATPVSILAALILTWVLVTLILVITHNAPNIWYWGR